jgi:hypothetical protein
VETQQASRPPKHGLNPGKSNPRCPSLLLDHGRDGVREQGGFLMQNKLAAGAVAGLIAGVVFGIRMQAMKAPTPEGADVPMMAMVAMVVGG